MDRTTQLLLDRLMMIEDTLVDLIGGVERNQADQGLILEGLRCHGPTGATRAPNSCPGAPILPSGLVLRAGAPAAHAIQRNIPDDKSPLSGQLAQPALSLRSTFDDVKDNNKGELSMLVGQTTAAHKPLMWPSIKELIRAHEYDEDFVMRLEEERGLINVYGQEEILSTGDGGGFDETSLDEAAQIQTNTTSDPSGIDIDSFGQLNLDAKTARRFYQTYLERMHPLHPFLNKPELDGKVEAFITCYCPRDTLSVSRNNNLCCENPPLKRKRSHAELQDICGGSVDAAAISVRPRVGRNIDNAIILLLFALGAICETNFSNLGAIVNRPDYLDEEIPGPRPPTGSRPAVNSTPVHNDTLLCADSHSTMPKLASFDNLQIHSTGHSFSSLFAEIRDQTCASKQSLPRPRNGFDPIKNLQVIPGLSLYRYAATILGLLQGGAKLEHIQAGLLAGLYAGQLAHPFQSHGWICQAARACQILVRQKRYEQLVENTATKNLYDFAYWTCLQLESDLLAELDVPASGISRFEGRISLPQGSLISRPGESGVPSSIMMFYLAQVHLQMILNRVHTDLYRVEKQGQTRLSSNVQEALSVNLELWRTSLPTTMSWTDEEPPAKDINAARLRAKYYEARCIIHRSLLYHALHYGHTGACVGSVAQTSNDSLIRSANYPQTQQTSTSMMHTGQFAPDMAQIINNVGRPPAEYSSFANGWTPATVALRELPPKLRRSCKICIESAILSTTAFDGIPDRLVLTNIFGTAHALSELVERSVLQSLLKRTIRFLLRHANFSPTLRADAKILTEIYGKIFGGDPDLN
ncbi:hypothetical protein N7523_005662 [Penicillium sp. IBT 18751x]|nr:hypothetical protein N7523_005662 [Penicillium sp. IBT 18751x]